MRRRPSREHRRASPGIASRRLSTGGGRRLSYPTVGDRRLSYPTVGVILSAAVGVLLLGGCTRSGGEPEIEDPEQDFARFAQVLYSEMERRPIDGERPVQIGLFGDLDVMAGENVVMGRYRYRVDTAAGPSAHMAFALRTAENPEPIPVLLRFKPDDGRWQLDDARHLGADTVDALVDEQLDEWVATAVRSAAHQNE